MSHSIVTLNKGQGYPNMYQNVEFCGLYYYSRFERNQYEHERTQANVRFVFVVVVIDKIMLAGFSLLNTDHTR